MLQETRDWRTRMKFYSSQNRNENRMDDTNDSFRK